ncbi:MAG: hypothetical protein NTZ27_00140 [Ignavibacteriales bacterium]|nr:hypothetical protein [Ignavibacteriales bacterium]
MHYKIFSSGNYYYKWKIDPKLYAQVKYNGKWFDVLDEYEDKKINL